MAVMTISAAGRWELACDEVAEEVLDDTGCRTRPVDAFQLAEEMGFQLAYDANQTGRGRVKRVAGRVTVLLAPDERPERLQWAAAHEIGEFAAHRVFDRLEMDLDEESPRLREKIASGLAAAVLLPKRWFFADARRLDGDVAALKAIYSTASHELILNRLLQMDQLTMASVFDHGRLTRRRTNGRLAAPPLLSLESEAQSLAHRTGEAVSLSGRGVRVQCWPVHERDWKRELVRTTALLEEGDWIDEAA
jgi:Zn-dependent peptidase ImmA (M78 family)